MSDTAPAPLAERLALAVLNTPDGEGMVQRAVAAVQAILDAAPPASGHGGWTTVTADGEGLPSGTSRDMILVEYPNGGKDFMSAATFRRHHEKRGTSEGIRWMPWPSSAPPAGSHAGLLREAAEAIKHARLCPRRESERLSCHCTNGDLIARLRRAAEGAA